ncbi:hypothetical protein FOCC_FOCC017345 [Frankliniella occidentalis]|nr:hypothetical protein FOCC_FOCC017345 [Frankliniella occidentalis]
MQTRKQDPEYMLGSPQEMSGRVLPTYEDAMRHYYLVSGKIKAEKKGYDPAIQEVSQVVADRVEEIWASASIPVISNRGILKAVIRFVEKCRKVEKNWKNPSPAVQAGVDKLREEARKLLDVAQCKCLPAKPLCVCSPKDIVSSDEVPFLVDQRSDRKMAIGGIDKKATMLIRRAEEKKVKKVAEVMEAEERSSAATFSANIGKKLRALCAKKTADEDTDVNVDADPEWRAPSPPRPSSSCSDSSSSSRNKLEFPSACRVAERFNLPSGAAAVFASAVLADVGVVKPEDTSLVVDRKKFSRQRQKFRSETREIELQKLRETQLLGLYFDGRQDKTQVREALPNNKIRVKAVTEEHVVLLAQPGDLYLGHVTPATHGADCLANTLLDFLDDARLETASLRCVGCDGCGTNTGWRGGAIRLMEETLGRPLQWHVCLLHANELPLRHVMETFDGPTGGPNTWSGPLGQQMKNCLELPVVRFQPIPLELPDPDLDSAILSKDQRYTLDMARAISAGECPPELAARNPGTVNHSRWGTTANRLMRLYVGTKRPSAALKNIVTIIIKMYVPMWFAVKMRWQCWEGPKHLAQMAALTRQFQKKYQGVLQKYVQNNAYFAHPENVLVAMVKDDRPAVRRLALHRILEARKQPANADEVRTFTVPVLNFAAEDYTTLIDWDSVQSRGQSRW